MSLEELQDLKKNQMAYMNEQLDYLEVEDKYTNLKANIAENRLREHTAKVRLASMLAPPEKSKEKDES